MDRARQYLGLARKAGLLTVGEESCGSAAAAGKARLSGISFAARI